MLHSYYQFLRSCRLDTSSLFKYIFLKIYFDFYNSLLSVCFDQSLLMSMMTSRAQMELEEGKFKWNVGVNFLNIISVLFNNWPEMRSVVDGLPEFQRKTLNNDIRKLIKNVFDCILIYGKDCNEKLTDQIIKGMNDDFHLIIEDFSAKEISAYILYMYAKWFYAEDFTENRLQVIAEIKNFSKPDPIVEFEDLPSYKIASETEEIMV